MAKKVNITNIKKEKKMMDEYLIVTVTSSISGEQYEVNVDKHMRKTKVPDVIAELMIQYKYAKEKGIDLNAIFTPYTMFLVLKHFTSLNDTIPVDLETQIDMMNTLSNMNLLEPLFDELPKDGLENVLNEIDKSINKMSENIFDIAETVQAIHDEMKDFEDNLEVVVVNDETE